MFNFTPELEQMICSFLAELASTPAFVFLDKDAADDRCVFSTLHCNTRIDGLEATLEQNQLNNSTHSVTSISRANLDNERSSIPTELEDGCVDWIMRRLRRYLFSVLFYVYTNHDLRHTYKISGSKPSIE